MHERLPSYEKASSITEELRGRAGWAARKLTALGRDVDEEERLVLVVGQRERRLGEFHLAFSTSHDMRKHSRFSSSVREIFGPD